MFRDYEDIIVDLSGADLVIEEAKSKLHELVKEEAKHMMQAYRVARDDLDNINRDIRRGQSDLVNLQGKIKGLEEEYEKFQKTEMPKRYIDRITRSYTGGFAPGDVVYVVEVERKTHLCDKCNGLKVIKAIIDWVEQPIACPKCNGRGTLESSNKVIKKSKISSVNFTLCFHEDRVGVWSSNVIYLQGKDWATPPKDIYRTQKEAEEAIGISGEAKE